MESSRSFLDRFYVCCNKIDGLYYLAARRLGVKENALSLLYTLDNGPPCSQKQLAEELLIPKTTINTIVKEYTDAGYLSLVPSGHSREKNITLTAAGRAYAQKGAPAHLSGGGAGHIPHPGGLLLGICKGR